jgi:tRNA threonylcarbamoyladenosine biosynthesis protein TsaB
MTQLAECILYLDTCTDIAFVALSKGADLLAIRFSTETRNHAAGLNVMIEEVMQEAGLTFQDLNAIAVCAGPGSYTGLRIGLATAKGLCFALDKPLMLFNKLDLLCLQSIDKNNKKYENYVAVLRAREAEYFISAHNKNLDVVIAPQHVNETELLSLLQSLNAIYLISDCIESNENNRFTTVVQIEKNIKININAWISIALSQCKAQNFAPLSSSEPFYLKDVYTHK